MSDAIEQQKSTPFPAEGAQAVAALDPLAGDWSEGLRASLRVLGIPEPKLLAIESIAPPPPPAPLPAPPAAAEVVEAPDAWAASSEDPLQSQPPPPAPAFLPDITPPSPAPAFEAPALAAPPTEPATPWSEPVAPPPATETPAWEAPPPPAPASAEPWSMQSPATPAVGVPPVEDHWSAPPAPAAAEEWKPQDTSDEWQEIKKTQAPELGAAQAADWGSLSKGPDWSAPPPADAAPADSGWGAPPPGPAESVWTATPPAGTPLPTAAESTEWGAPPPAPPPAEKSWTAPAPVEESVWAPPPPPAARPTWSAPPAGASALEQLDSEPEPVEPAPGAAKDLFGSVPAGGSLGGEDDEPEKPVELSDDDADLLVPIDEDSMPPPPPRPATPLASMLPVSQSPLEVRGENRVAVHTRGGRTVRGTVKDIDLAKPHFPLAPQGGGDLQSVYHSDVKAIFFMLVPGEKAKPGDGKKVRVTFADGRTIDGHRDGGEGKHGFFIVPLDAQRTNTRRIYIAREATSDVKDL
jgi:hypothetical protein